MTITFYTQAFARQCRSLAAATVLSVALASMGCATPSHTEDGLVGGAIFGGILGTLVGIVTHHPAAGALIGAGAGAAIGGATGAAEDHAEKRVAVAQAQAYAEQQSKWPTLQQIAQMTANGTSDPIIINQIRTTGAIYSLTAADIQYLQQYHVSDAVITEMQATANRPQPSVVVQPGPVYVEPYGPPVVRVVGPGWGYGYGYRRW